LYQNEPNPFSTNTSISFPSLNAAKASVSVFDTEGRLLLPKQINTDKGSMPFHFKVTGS